MANIQLSTAITRAISSGAYFTRVDQDKIQLEDKELQSLNPELYKSRLEKFDSPNNIKGIIIQQTGIYVETYHGYGYIDKKDGQPKHIGQRIKTDKNNNEQFASDVQKVYQGEQHFTVNNNWLFQPVIQNLQYVYFDEVLSAIAGRHFNGSKDIIQVLVQTVINAPGAKGKPTRQRFPKLKRVTYVLGLGKAIAEHRDWFNKIYSSVGYDQLWLDNYCKETGNPKAELDLTKVNGWGPCSITQTREEIYLYDKYFISEQVSKEQQAIDEQKKADSERNKQIEKEGYGIPGVIETKEQYKDIIEQYLVNPVIAGYKYLIQIGYSGPRSNDGMLTGKAGQIYLGQSGKLILPSRPNSNDKSFMIKDIDLYTKVDKAMKNQGINIRQLTNSQVDQAALQLKDSIPYYNQLLTANENEVAEFNYALGLKLIKGYLSNCKMHKEYSQGQVSQTQIINWQSIKEYLKETLTDLCAILLVTNGIVKVNQSAQDFMTSNEIQIVTQYCQNLRKVFCFGIYTQKQFQLSNDKELLQTELRICLPNQVNIDKFFNDLQSEMPVKLVKINSAQQERNSIYNMFALKVMYDEDPTKGMIQATKALEQLKEKNLKPQWSKALLGEKDDGTPFFWQDFMGSNNSPYKRAYQIYAGSRSGKGILTNTLIANAVANGYKVFFVDGKPDTGITLGNLAWKEGKEAFVFDGMRAGQSEFQPGQLEDYSYGIRQPNEQLVDINRIPEGIRNIKIPTDIIKRIGQADFGELITATTVYYKCVELIFKLIEYRAAGNHGTPDEDWAIFVIDECAKMAERESFIRKYFFNYVKSVGARHNNGIPYRPTTKDESKVVWGPELQFIANWLNWLDGIQSSVQTAQTMSLGNSQQNIFFIFQGSKWISQYSETFMCKGLMKLSTTKILGHDAIEDRAPSNYGNTSTKNSYEWPKYLNDAMHWVITKDSDAGNCPDDKVCKFMPYSLWGSTKGQMIDGQPDDFRYMQYYMREIGETFGINVADVLNSAYMYAQEFVANVSNKQSLKEYLYSLSFLLEDYSGQAEQTAEQPEDEFELVDEPPQFEQTGFSFQSTSRKQAEESLDAVLNKPNRRGGTQAQSQAGQPRIYAVPKKSATQQMPQQNTQQGQEYQVDDDYGLQFDEPTPQGQQAYPVTDDYGMQFDKPQDQGAYQVDDDYDMQFDEPQGQQAYPVTDDYGMQFDSEQPSPARDPSKFEVKQFKSPFKINRSGDSVELDETSNTTVATDAQAQRIGKKGNVAFQWIRNKVDRYSPVALASNAKYAIKQQSYNLMACGALLDALADQAGGYRNLRELQIIQNQIWVNGKYLYLPQYMQDEEGNLNIQNIIRFRKLFKNFKNLRVLTIDQDLWVELKEEFIKDGANRIQNIFNKHKNLQNIVIISQVNGKAVQIDRQTGLRFNCADTPEDKVRKAIESSQKTSKTKQIFRDQKRLQIIGRAKNAISCAKDEAWGQPANKALTITTTLATMGLIGLTFGPLVLLGASFAQNVAVRKIIHK